MVLGMNAHAYSHASEGRPDAAVSPTGYGPESQAVGQIHPPACVVHPRGADLLLTGEMDLHNADEVAACIMPWLHDEDNHLDLTAVDFIDSMGLSVLVRAYILTARRGASLRITCSPTVHTVLSMAGFTDRLPGLDVVEGETDGQPTTERG